MRNAVALLLLAPLAGTAATPEAGKPAPSFTLPAANVQAAFPDQKDKATISLSDFKGKKNVVLFFYPKAMTRG